MYLFLRAILGFGSFPRSFTLSTKSLSLCNHKQMSIIPLVQALKAAVHVIVQAIVQAIVQDIVQAAVQAVVQAVVQTIVQAVGPNLYKSFPTVCIQHRQNCAVDRMR